ncbi:MAG TPA: hydroxymethylbilane synthase [Acidobacteriota bacterium]|nr:hydroxymethylbilane synthase [Acidobacteriota bacterium]
MKYRIATRGSKLALFQANHVQAEMRRLFPAQEWELEIITTTGDKFLDKPLSAFGGKGAFLKEIEEALLAGRAQLAVHSLKDVPSIETAGLRLSAFLPREDPRDVWVCKKEDLFHIPPGSRIGTSSLRRQILLRFFRPDLDIQMLRGNLDTRIRKLREDKYDAVVVAAAGLHRLQLLDDSIMQYLHEDAFIPAIGQAVMVVQTVSAVPEVHDMVRRLNHAPSETAARIEREFLAFYEGGCQLPIGGLARLVGDHWRFRAFVGGIKSNRIVQDSVEELDPGLCARRLYDALEAQGARELLAELNAS